MKIIVLNIATVVYVVFGFSAGYAIVRQYANDFIWLLTILSILAYVFALLHISIRKLKYPDIIKPLSWATLLLSCFFPRYLFPQEAAFQINYIIDTLTVVLAAVYLEDTKRENIRKWPMRICLALGVLLFISDGMTFL